MRGPTRRELLLASGAAALAALGRKPAAEGFRRVLAAWESTRPDGIVVHHSATSPDRQPFINAEAINADHRRRGMAALHRGRVYHIGYHYVILPDGRVEPGRPESCRGAHTRSWRHNHWTGICLIGWFDPVWPDPRFHRPSDAQMDALVALSLDLIGRHRFPLENILPHRAVNETLCPGRSFPMDEYLEGVRRAARADTIGFFRAAGRRSARIEAERRPS